MISLYIVCLVLVLVGALNWGLVGAAHFNLVTSATSLVLSNPSTVQMVSRVVYVAVGLSALYVTWVNKDLILHH